VLLEEEGFILEEERGTWSAAFAILAREEVREPQRVLLDMVGKRATEESEQKERKGRKMTRRRKTSSAIENYWRASKLGLMEGVIGAMGMRCRSCHCWW
jgi:hypothetical protein